MLRTLISFALLLVVASSPTPEAQTPRGSPELVFNFYKEAVKAKPGNVIVSPLSIRTALSLLSLAANGKTFEDLTKALQSSDDKAAIADLFHGLYGSLERGAGNSTLSTANQIYVHHDYKLNKNFQNIAAEKFGSGVESINFADSAAAAQRINSFVAEKTKDKIKDLVKADSFDDDTRVYLVNAIYFKGAWEHPFSKEYTIEGPFHVSDTETVPVDYMTDERNFNYAILSELKATALELKYADSKFSFVIILPNEGSSLTELEANLKGSHFAQIPFYSQKVDVKIPKFKVEYEIKLNDVLKELGLGNIFSSAADFSGLLGDTNEKLKVSEVVHKAFIDVNEEGSEAAAATGVGFVAYAMPIAPPPRFHADRPFLYVIRDTVENAIPFSGRIERPTKS